MRFRAADNRPLLSRIDGSRKKLALLLGAAGLLSACVPLPWGGGKNAWIDTTVRFQMADNTPARQITVSQTESVSDIGRSTDLRTDERGEVHLAGYYCTPVTVYSGDGDGISIGRETVRPYYTVTLGLDHYRADYRATGGGGAPAVNGPPGNSETSPDDAGKPVAAIEAGTSDVNRERRQHCRDILWIPIPVIIGAVVFGMFYVTADAIFGG